MPGTPPLTRGITIVLTYYAPYVSGLTNVARDLAEGLARKGRRVTVVAAQHDPALPREETLNGVRVLRAPVALKIGKGVISPRLVALARRESRTSQLLNIHAPMLEAGMIASLSYAPVVLTYHCDVSLGGSLLGRLQERVIDHSTGLAARLARLITVSSEDYGDRSRLAAAFTGKRAVIAPPCHARTGGKPIYRDGEGLHIGFLGRIVEEKGIDYLVAGFRALNDPKARLLLAGDFTRVAGGSAIRSVRRSIGEDRRIRLMGYLPEAALADFYASLDAFVLPSVNPLEAFGIVQVEAMMNGIPVIATDLPGVRQPVLKTGLGEIIEPGSARAVTKALEDMRVRQYNRKEGAKIARDLYGAETIIETYDRLFQAIAPYLA